MIKTLLKLSGRSQPWREWKRVGRFVFGQINQWSFSSICRWSSFGKSYFLFPFWRYIISFHRRGQYVEGGTFKRFLLEERASHSAFSFTPVPRSNANRIYKFHVLVKQSFQNLQVVKRQRVGELARRLIYTIIQAAVSVSVKYSLYKSYFKCLKTHFQ